MRVIFVGVHNKVGKSPLCSSTKSGKLIDRIIKEGGLREYEAVVKTNLYDTCYLPRKVEKNALAIDWLLSVNPTYHDIVVFLGAETHAHIPPFTAKKVLKIAHPASKRSHEAMNEYVKDTIMKIKK